MKVPLETGKNKKKIKKVLDKSPYNTIFIIYKALKFKKSHTTK